MDNATATLFSLKQRRFITNKLNGSLLHVLAYGVSTLASRVCVCVRSYECAREGEWDACGDEEGMHNKIKNNHHHGLRTLLRHTPK